MFSDKRCVGALVGSQWVMVLADCLHQHKHDKLKVGLGMEHYDDSWYPVQQMAASVYTWNKFGLVYFDEAVDVDRNSKTVDVVRLPSVCDKSVPSIIKSKAGNVAPPRDGNCGGDLGRDGVIVAGGGQNKESAVYSDSFRVSEGFTSPYSECNNISSGLIRTNREFCGSASYPNSLCRRTFFNPSCPI